MSTQRTGTDIAAPIVPILPGSFRGRKLPLLEAGDYLGQKTFHERYSAMPPDFRAELIEGNVIVPSPTKPRHGRTQLAFGAVLGTYIAATPGTDGMDNATTILGERCELQPDGSLYILPELGGNCRVSDDDVSGPPELVGEVALSSEAYDLHGKYREYERAGVLEYVVVMLREQTVRWFILRNGAYDALVPDSTGVFRSVAFPGLWLDSIALLRGDFAGVLAMLQQGLQSPEHAAFVAELQSRGTRS